MYWVGRFVPGRRVVQTLKKLIVNCGKDFVLREVVKTRQRGVNLSSAFRHKWRKDEVPVAENTLIDAVERAGAG